MEANNFVLGLDIGTSKICAVICEVDSEGKINLKGIGTSVTLGIKRGIIEDTDELYRAIDRAISRAVDEASVKPSKVLVNFPVKGVQFVHHFGLLVSKEVSGQISLLEKKECVTRSKNIVKPADQKMVHVIPYMYKVDGVQTQTPVGTYGKTLEVQTHVILASSELLMKLLKVLKNMEVTVNGIIYDTLAASEVLLTEEERAQGSILVDIGGQFTKIGLFQNGFLTHAASFPIGGDTFTRDLSHCLKVSEAEAERLKIIQSDCCLSRVNPNDSIEISTISGERKTIKRLLLCQIVEARVTELIGLISKKINTYPIDPKFKFVLTGGGSLLKGLSERFEKEFDFSYREGLPESMRTIIESSSNATAVGLVLYALRTEAIGVRKKESRWKEKVKRILEKVF